jgi:hypothetical protein
MMLTYNSNPNDLEWLSISNFIIWRTHIWKPYLENFNHFIVLYFYVFKFDPSFHKSLIVIYIWILFSQKPRFLKYLLGIPLIWTLLQFNECYHIKNSI